MVWAESTAAQTETDYAEERLKEVNTLWALRLRPMATLAIAEEVAGAGGVGFTAAGLEKRGAAWDALRLDRLQLWSGGELEIAFTAFSAQQIMLGTDIDHDLCMAAAPVVAFGDCLYGGWFGWHLQLLRFVHETSSGRWFHRYAEAGVVFSFIGDSFARDFVTLRLPITLGLSVEAVNNTPLPPGEARTRLRGLAELALVHRFAGYRHELTSAVAFRPALAPFDFAEDFAVEARVRIAYVWLARLAGTINEPAQRVYLELRASRWEKPWLAEQPFLGKNSVQITAGFELTLADITPS